MLTLRGPVRRRLKSAFGIGATPPPSSLSDDFSYACLNKSPTRFPAGTRFLPGFTPPRSSPPLEVEDTKPALAIFALPAHLRPPTPPCLLAPGPPAPAFPMDGLLTRVKAEKGADDAWPAASMSAGLGVGGGTGLAWATQELKAAVRVPSLPHAPQLPLGWGMQAAEVLGRMNKRAAEDEGREAWRRGWAGW